MESKRLLICTPLVTLLIVIFAIIVVYCGWKLSYAFKVDYVIRSEVKELYSTYGAMSPSIYPNTSVLPRNEPAVFEWNDSLIKTEIKQEDQYRGGYRYARSSTYILRSKDGKEWNNFVNLGSAVCSYWYFGEDQIICINSESELLIIGENGDVSHINPFPQNRGNGLFGIFSKDNYIYLVWPDSRSRFIKLSHYLDPLGTSLWGIGPYVIMAGKFDLNTLRGKEYIIQYGPEYEALIFGDKIWRWL